MEWSEIPHTIACTGKLMLKYFIMIVICHGKLAIANHTSTTTGGINVDMYGIVDTFQLGSDRT